MRGYRRRIAGQARWYLVATEDRMIPQPAQQPHSGTINTIGKRLLAPGKSGAGRGRTQFGITRRPQPHRSASSDAAGMMLSCHALAMTLGQRNVLTGGEQRQSVAVA
jgi:hypothetical protein